MEEQYGAHNYHPLDVVIERGEGVWVYDVDGKKYLDCLAAYSAVNQGHCHPRIMQAVVEQVKRVTLTSRAFRNDQLPLLYKLLHDLTGYDMSLPMNSGAEAVETAVKAARKWGYTVKGIPKDQAEIIVCANNFHGRTTTIVSFSTDEQYRDGFGPLTPGFTVIPFGDAAALEAAITPNTAAFLVEPIQGEAGIIIPPDGLPEEGRGALQGEQRPVHLRRDPVGPRPHRQALRAPVGGRPPRHGHHRQGAVRRLLPHLGGAGRAGTCWASSSPGDHGSTFGGNPLACAVARAALQVLIDEKLVERSAELGEYFLARLQAITSPVIKEVRGRGLWIGVELTVAARPVLRAPDAGRHALQGNPRPRHPPRAAARHHARGDRLGRRAAEEGLVVA